MWRYTQSTGQLEESADGVLWRQVWRGYSGYGRGLNDPDMQEIEAVGPIPIGEYMIGAPYDSEHTGPYTLPLEPRPGTNTFGRSAFKIHGDKKYGPPQSASHGCIIAPKEVREAIHESCDNDLLVISGRQDA